MLNHKRLSFFCTCSHGLFTVIPPRWPNFRFKHLNFTEQIVVEITKALNEAAPLRTCNRRLPKTETKWLTEEARDAKGKRRRLERTFRATGRDVDGIAYRRCCRVTNKVIMASRRRSFQERLDCCGDPGERWRVAKELLHSSGRDLTRTKEECASLAFSFSDFFTSKIHALKLTLCQAGLLSSLSSLSRSLPFLIHARYSF